MNINYDMIIPVLLSFGIGVLMGPVVIPFVRRLKVGQTVRDDGPETDVK